MKGFKDLLVELTVRVAGNLGILVSHWLSAS